MKVLVKRVGSHTLPLPKYETEGASGFDLRAQLDGHQSAVLLMHPKTRELTRCLMLSPGERAYFRVGFAFEVPEGYELQVRPRSGLAKKHDVVAWHPIGTVDSDYRGEVQAALHNRGMERFAVWHGDRIAQGVIAPVWQAELEEVESLSETSRGAKGFGSTGVSDGGSAEVRTPAKGLSSSETLAVTCPICGVATCGTPGHCDDPGYAFGGDAP